MNIEKTSTTARNWFVGSVVAVAFCFTSSDEVNDAQRSSELSKEAQLQAKHEAKIQARARQIAEQMEDSQP